tara:strand:+ start:12615 stop:13562 length:948 start_codon:yes stop_codon:yes gene_type:complete
MPITARDVHIDRPLSNLVVGFEPQGTIVQNFLPIVNVNKQSDLYFKYEKGDFFRIPSSTERAPKTKGRTTHFNVSSESYYATNYALVDEMDFETLVNQDDPLKLKEKGARNLVNLLMLDMENRIASQTRSVSNMGSGSTVASKWSSSTAGTSDPFGDIALAKNTIRSQTGYDANTMIIGREAYNALVRHADILDRIKYVQRGVVTADLLASLFDIPNVYVGNSIINTGEENLADSFSDVWGDDTIIAHFAQPETDGKNPSLMYGFRWTNPLFGSPMAVESWDDPDHRNFTNLRVQYYQDEKITAKDLGYVLKDCA